MADVTPPKAVDQVNPAGPRGDRNPDSTDTKESEDGDNAEDNLQEEGRQGNDIAFILGVPASDISPEIQKGLSSVMYEFDRQRRELDFLRKRVAFLEKISDTHPFLQIMSRHAFERSMTKVVNRIDQSQTENAFVCFQLEGLESIRHLEGLSVADLIVTNAANMIKSELRASDIIGSMGGYGIGVIFTVTTYDGAEEKVRQLVSGIEQKLQATYPDLKLVYGVYSLKAHDTVSHIFSAADEDLRKRFSS